MAGNVCLRPAEHRGTRLVTRCFPDSCCGHTRAGAVCVPHIKPKQCIVPRVTQVAARGCVNGTGPGSSRQEAHGHRPAVPLELPTARPAVVMSGSGRAGASWQVGAVQHRAVAPAAERALPGSTATQHHQPAAHFPQLLATFRPDTLSPLWRRSRFVMESLAQTELPPVQQLC